MRYPNSISDELIEHIRNIGYIHKETILSDTYLINGGIILSNNDEYTIENSRINDPKLNWMVSVTSQDGTTYSSSMYIYNPNKLTVADFKFLVSGLLINLNNKIAVIENLKTICNNYI